MQYVYQKRRFFDKIALRKRHVFFLSFIRSSRARAGPIWTHTGPYGPIWALMDPYGPEESPKIRKTLALLGAFKGTCTLP